MLQDGRWLWSRDIHQIPVGWVKPPAHTVTLQVALLLKPFIHNAVFFRFHNDVTFGVAAFLQVISGSVSVKPTVQSPALSLLISQKRSQIHCLLGGGFLCQMAERPSWTESAFIWTTPVYTYHAIIRQLQKKSRLGHLSFTVGSGKRWKMLDKL